jgi:hypothetical protein
MHRYRNVKLSTDERLEKTVSGDDLIAFSEDTDDEIILDEAQEDIASADLEETAPEEETVTEE